MSLSERLRRVLLLGHDRAARWVNPVQDRRNRPLQARRQSLLPVKERRLMKRILMSLGLCAATASTAVADTRAQNVTFKSGGEEIAGILYTPVTATARLPAIVVVPPWVNVKEQVATRYAQKLAEAGFATLAFDFRYWGKSGGKPREYESAAAKIEDIRAAIDFLHTRAEVDRERIGMLGVCFGAGHALAAASRDGRVKAVATVAAWLHDRASLVEWFGKDEIDRRYRVGREARARHDRSGQVTYVPAASTTDKTAAMHNPDPAYFYNTSARGAIPQWTNRMAVLSWPEWLDFDVLPLAASFRTPLLMVHSDGSALPGNVRKFHAAAPGPKRLAWLEGNHVDFYDRPKEVSAAVRELVPHFRQTLAARAK
jgi:uncharacterized protein